MELYGWFDSRQLRLLDLNRPPATECPAALGSTLCGFQTSKDMVKDGRQYERRTKGPKQTNSHHTTAEDFGHSGNDDAKQAGPWKYWERYGLIKNQARLTRYPERCPTARPLHEPPGSIGHSALPHLQHVFGDFVPLHRPLLDRWLTLADHGLWNGGALFHT